MSHFSKDLCIFHCIVVIRSRTDDESLCSHSEYLKLDIIGFKKAMLVLPKDKLAKPLHPAYC